MSFAEECTVYRNGDWIPQSRAHIALNDFGFLQGVTITDLVRTFQGKPYLVGDHVRRFLETCTESQVLPPGYIEEAALIQVAESIVLRNLPLAPTGSELAIVFLATPGTAEHYLQGNGGVSHLGPTLIVHTFPVPRARYGPWFQCGASLCLVEHRQVPGVCYPPRWKTRSRLHWWLAERQAKIKEPGSLALLQNQKGEILETALAHLVLVGDGELLCPPADEVLQGISLNKLKTLALGMGLNWKEQPLRPQDLSEAREVLLTGTMFCVAGVSLFEGKPIPWPGRVLLQLQEKWSFEIGQNLSDWFVKKP